MKNWQKNRRMIAVLIVFALALTLGPINIAELASKKAKLNITKVSLTEGKTKQLKLLNKPKGAKVSWKSANSKIAKISNNGKITAKAKGKTKVTCSVKVKKKTTKYTCTITVIKKMVATKQPTKLPTRKPVGSLAPTNIPNTPQSTMKASASPEVTESVNPTATPTDNPTTIPTTTPTASPTVTPTTTPTASPTVTPTATPTASPTVTTTIPSTPSPLPTGAEGQAIKIDFEDGTNPYFTGRNGTEVLTVQSGGYNDNYCLKVSNRTSNWQGPKVFVNGNLEDYTAYRVEAYVKHTAGGDKNINMTWDINYASSGERRYAPIQSVSVPTENWKKIDKVIILPGDTSELYLYFEMEDTSDFYIDNLTVTKTEMNRDAVLSVDSLKDAFASYYDMGCAINTYQMKNPDVLAFIKHHYSTITYDIETKPGYLLMQDKTKASKDGMPVINTDRLDECMTLAKDNGLKVRVHTLLWHEETPDWFFCENYIPEYDGSGSTGKTNITNLVDRATMLQRVNSYVTQVVTYIETNYPGVAYAYDVVNEVVNGSGLLRKLTDNSLYGAIFNETTSLTQGDNAYVTEAFKAAKMAANNCGSSVKMYYNDYEGLTSGMSKAIVSIMADAKASGYIDGIGMQCHLSNLSVSDGDSIKSSFVYYGQNGYEVNITELDFGSRDNSETGNAILASAYKKFFEIVNNCKKDLNVKINNVTFWGLTDTDSWLSISKDTCFPLLFDGDYMPKPAYYAVMQTAPDYVAPSSSPTAMQVLMFQRKQ